MFADGRVNVIGFGVIAERLGRRWPDRRDLVHDHAARTLQRHLAGAGTYLRISETDYVVIQPGAGRFGAQIVCINALRETLTHFLGEARLDNVLVHEVTRITPEGVFGERVNVAVVEATSLSAPEPPDTDPLGPIAQWTPFVSCDGRRVRVSCQLEPVIQLKSSERIGYRMARRVLAMPSEVPLTASERHNLARADIERVDFATLARGLDRLRSTPGATKEPTLILPISYATLSSRNARPLIAEFFRAAQATVKHGLVGEVCDIDNVPSSALLGVISLIRPYCLFVIGQLGEATSANIRNLCEAKLQGVSIECPLGVSDDAAFIGWTQALIKVARPAIKSVIVYRLKSIHMAAIAGALGVTHASLSAI
jgi:hypothetical protein